MSEIHEQHRVNPQLRTAVPVFKCYMKRLLLNKLKEMAECSSLRDVFVEWLEGIVFIDLKVT